MLSGPRADRAWLTQAAWPRWLADGIDRKNNSFREALALDGSGCIADFRRLRVVSRQIYVFSKAYEQGVTGADEAVAIGLNFLGKHAAHAEGGYAWRFDLQHRSIDDTRDLYDHAFVLLAFASAATVVPNTDLRVKAEALTRWILGAFSHPAGGFLESLPPALPRRQNPHMHFLEALLAAHEAFGGTLFLDAAHDLIRLFRDRIFDRQTGTLPEFFDDDWNVRRQRGLFLVEPGHHGHLVDVLGSDGSVIEAGARLWPQTEWLRAEHLRPDPDGARQQRAGQSVSSLLRADGLWHERRGADGALWQGPAPASSLYHLTGAILSIGVN
jgi:mannose-6-phosphate isomerase